MPQFLWVGCLESEDEFVLKAKKGNGLSSAQVSQINIINGIERLSGLNFDTINGSVLPHYPIYKDKLVEETIWSRYETDFNISVSYKNLKYINRIDCKNSMIKAADKWIKTVYKGGELIIFAYSMRSSAMATATYIKSKIKKAKIYLIVTDLPQFMDLSQNKVKAFLKEIDWIQIKQMQKKFDGFILYSSEMAEFLKIPNDKWMLMEGSYEENKKLEIEKKETSIKSLIYSGMLEKQYGINLLLDAFMKIKDDNLELWLTGGGNAEDYIKECAEKDNRIKFYGFLPSREDVLKKQREATALINMRLPSEEASKYCFPSKLFEYMVTGIPVISFKLGGIPQEYYPYLTIIENENEESIIKAINSVLYKPQDELDKQGNLAKEFILNNKTAVKQCERIISWLNI